MRKWKCIRVGNKKEWTVGKIYETGDDGSGLISDTGLTEWIQPWNFTLEEYFGLGAKFEEVKQFSLSDIKPCMVVQIRDGRLCMVIERSDGLGLNLLEDLDYGICSLNNYNELNSKYDEEDRYDIINVYGFSPYANGGTLSIKNRPLLWSRNQSEIEQLEKQKSEIEAKLKQLKGE